MSNTWDYRFAFQIDGPPDVPEEFRRAYENVVESEGGPLFSLFTPAMEQGGALTSDGLPPKLILVFRDSLAVLSLETQSEHVSTFKWKIEDLLGYGLGNFLLSSWLALYPGNLPKDRLQIQFPPQALTYYQDLFRFLLCWSEGVTESTLGRRRDSCRSIAGLPPKFSAFLESYPELGEVSEFFIQPAIQLYKDRPGRWANLLLTAGPHRIIALSDRYREYPSEYGGELRFFPLSCVKSVDWTDLGAGYSAAIRVDVQGVSLASRFSWPVFSGLRPYGLRWTREVEFLLSKVKREQAYDDTAQPSAATG